MTFIAPLTAGHADFPLPIPCDTALLGLVLKAQRIVVDAILVGCPLLHVLQVSTGLRVVFDN